MIKKQKFEFAIYNEQARQAVKQGEHHKFFKDDWQNQHFIEIDAYSEKDATARIRARYPEDQGFAILACRQVS